MGSCYRLLLLSAVAKQASNKVNGRAAFGSHEPDETKKQLCADEG